MGHDITNCGSDKVDDNGTIKIELSIGIESPSQGAMMHIAMGSGEFLTMAQWNTLRSSAANEQTTTLDWANDLEDKSPDWYDRAITAATARGIMAATVRQALRNHAKRYNGFIYPEPL